MKIKIIAITLLLAVSGLIRAQTPADINKTDQMGRKQGKWIKMYPGGTVQYEGIFKDNHPVGEFRRYYEDKTLQSVLIFSQDGRTAEATIYHPNGFIASQGKYVDQKKEGGWKFFSSLINGYLLNREEYKNNIKNGLSLKFYPDSTIAEKINYVNDNKEGEWLQYYPDGKLFLKSYYSGGMLNGKFDTWYNDGKPEFSGYYKNNLRDGKWLIYNEDGKVKYEVTYVDGITSDHQMEKDAANFIDSLEKNKDKIADPEQTGVIR
jgi:antitoxin component YwqK of YwqJK toxin-antitoxin module